MINYLLTLVEGPVGAILMVISFLIAITATIFAWKRKEKGLWVAALLFLVLSVGLFVGRSFLATFFNDVVVIS